MSIHRIFEKYKQTITLKHQSSYTDEYGYKRITYTETSINVIIDFLSPERLRLMRDGKYSEEDVFFIAENTVDISLGDLIVWNDTTYKVVAKKDIRYGYIEYIAVKV